MSIDREFVREVEGHINRFKEVPIIIIDCNNDDYLQKIGFRCDKCNSVIKAKTPIGRGSVVPGIVECPICSKRKRFGFLNYFVN